MSLRYLSSANGLLIVPVFVLGLGIGYANAQTAAPSVETYVDQAVPVETPFMRRYEGAPLPAGTLTLDDVLKAHPRKKPPRPPASAASGLMMSKGLKAVLQKLDPLSVPAGTQASKIAAPSNTLTLAPKVAASSKLTKSKTEKTTPSLVSGTPDTAYAPGQAPKTFESTTSAPVTENQLAPASSDTAGDSSCSKDVKKWEKSCSEAGYPSAFVGKISGETRTGCSDGALHDVWVTNTCAPPDVAAPIQKEAAPAVQKETAPVAQQGEIPVVQIENEEPAVQEAISSSIQKEPARIAQKKEKAAGVKKTVVPLARKEVEAAPVVAASSPEQTATTVPIESPAPQEKIASKQDDPCGAAAETMAYEAPQKDLCRTGTASAVKGNGPWAWSCAKDGVESPCETLSLTGETAVAPSQTTQVAKASKTKVAAVSKPVCGATSGQPASTAPTTDLCQEGKAGVVKGSNPWNWTCSKGKKKVSCATMKPAEEAAKPETTKPAEETAKPVPAKPAENVAILAPPVETLSIPPAPSKLFAPRPTPSRIPEAAKVTGDAAPPAAPGLSATSNPVQPPAIRDTLPPAPALQEPAVSAAPHTSGPPLVLDPTISTVLFTRGSGTIEPSVLVTLDKLVAVLQKNPGARISLIAYADSSGSAPREAHRLSLLRALAVRNYLSSKGVSETRVDVHAEGASASTGYADRVDVKPNE
jgi:outer membrane protein OmpA-like peptidoglycan-associated protein